MAGYSVDIIIPVFNKKELTENCLKSIESSFDLPYRIILIDNSSGADTKDFLENYKTEHDNVVLVRNMDNLGWVKAVNQGIRLSDSPYLCIMNNDTVVRTDGWLSKMINIAELESDIGLVNPRFEVKKKIEKDKPYIEVDFCRGYCILIKRAVIDKIGVLDEAYGLGYYDDDDYSVRAIRAGFRCVRANDVIVEHLRDSTFTAIFKNDKRRALHDKNKMLFYSKWGRRLKIVFVLTNYSEKEKISGILFSLARRQHIIYVWNMALPLKLEHINIRERRLPALFSSFLLPLNFYINSRKEKGKRYDAVFFDHGVRPGFIGKNLIAYQIDPAKDRRRVESIVDTLALT